MVTKNEHWRDELGNPAGGCSFGPGFAISWQNGPVATEPNGAQVDDIIEAAISRLEFFQNSRFSSEYNARSLAALQEALDAQRARTADRVARGAEGTYTE